MVRLWNSASTASARLAVARLTPASLARLLTVSCPFVRCDVPLHRRSIAPRSLCSVVRLTTIFGSFQRGNHPRKICDLLLDNRSLQHGETPLAQMLFSCRKRLFTGRQMPLGDTRIGTAVRMALGDQWCLALDGFQTVRDRRIEETIIEEPWIQGATQMQ